VNVVDSSGWLEYFADGPYARIAFAAGSLDTNVPNIMHGIQTAKRPCIVDTHRFGAEFPIHWPALKSVWWRSGFSFLLGFAGAALQKAGDLQREAVAAPGIGGGHMAGVGQHP